MCTQGGRKQVFLGMISLAGLVSCRPSIGGLEGEGDREGNEVEKTILTEVKNDLTTYIQNTDLLNTNAYQYYLTFPEKLSTYNVTFDAGSTSFNKGTLGNLALIGAAGFLLSFIPQETLGALLETDPMPALRASPVSDLEELGLFQNPYTESNNPVGGIRDILPVKRNDDLKPVAVAGNIVATNDKKGDWNRMDSVVGYEVEYSPQHLYGEPHSSQLEYSPHHQYGEPQSSPDEYSPLYGEPQSGQHEYSPPHLYQEPYSSQLYQPAPSSNNHVVLPEPNTVRESRIKERNEKDLGFFKNMEKKISNFFLESPVARISEEIGFGTILNKVSSFWNENFSWEAGKFSPKNILESRKAEVEGREERQLDAPQEKLDTEDLPLKVEVSSDVGVGASALMSDTMGPPPPPEYHLLR